VTTTWQPVSSKTKQHTNAISRSIVSSVVLTLMQAEHTRAGQRITKGVLEKLTAYPINPVNTPQCRLFG
jgi:hypothetical protein